MPTPGEQNEDLERALFGAYPELAAVRELAAAPVYLVGGAVRDLLAGRGRADIDLVVVGDAAALAAALGGARQTHERFGTAKLELNGHQLDLAAARRESYPEPGALPLVVPADSIEADLGRRDFTINAMALPLWAPSELVDPHGGQADLEAGRLRVLHDASFRDDPTRALRAARYAARFGFAPEPRTERLLRAARLGAVSADRRRAELLRLAAEASAPRAFELLAEWGLATLRPGGAALAARVGELLEADPWRGFAPRPGAVLAAALGDGAAAALGRDGAESAAAAGEEAPDRAAELAAAAPGRPSEAVQLAAATPERPSEAVELARGHDPVELALARALGAEWLDRYLAEWRLVSLEIGGADLLAAGVAAGPAVGRGLRAALAAKLDGELGGEGGREEELAAALAAAGT